MNVKEALRKIGMKLEVKEIERKNWRGDIQKDIDENIILDKTLISLTRNVQMKSNVRNIFFTNLDSEVYFLSYNSNAFIVVFKKIGNDIYILQGIKKPLYNYWIIEREKTSNKNINNLREDSKEMMKAGSSYTDTSWEPVKMSISLLGDKK